MEPSSGLMLTAPIAYFILMSFSLWFSSSSLCFKVVTWLEMVSLFCNELPAAHCSVIVGCRSSAVYIKTALILAAQLSALQLATLMSYCIISMMKWINVFKGLTAVHFKQSGNTTALLEWTDENLIISDLGNSFPLQQHALVIFQVDEACKPVSTLGP